MPSGPYTKSQLASALADKADISKSAASEVLASLQTIALSQLKSQGSFTVPGLVKLVVKHKKATPARTAMMFGRETRISAKPAKKVVRGRILRVVKDAV